jgi:hypothetical protein
MISLEKSLQEQDQVDTAAAERKSGFILSEDRK